jgi:hypothetical protein
MVDSLQSREECSLIDSSDAENSGVSLREDLTIGPGGWEVVHHDNEYLLVHGQMPDLLWSLGLLKKLMSDSVKVPDDVLNFSTRDTTSYLRRIEFQKLIAGNPFKQDFVDALLGNKSGEQFLVESLNPWSTVHEECESYRTRFTLDAPKDELSRERSLWEKRDSAKGRLKELHDNYKQRLESGNLWTSQDRALIEVMYNGRICILDGKQPVTTDSDDTSDIDHPRFRTTISTDLIRGHAIEQDAIDKIRQPDLLGDTLIASADANEKLRRTVDRKRFDLIEGFYEKMREVVDSDHWDIAGDWVLTDSVLISPSNDMQGLWLHKLHHLHITALYSALSELGN